MGMIKTQAAVAWGPGQPLSIEEVDLMHPQKGEVLVRIVATGVCHTDAYTLSGSDPEGKFPTILGHEGGGIVEALKITLPRRKLLKLLRAKKFGQTKRFRALPFINI